MIANHAEGNDHSKCDAKVVSNVYQVVRVFLITIIIPLHICQKAVLSMLHLCDVLDLLLEKSVRVTSAQLRSAILQHLQAFQNAYDKIGWLPKHHMATHLPLQKLPLLNCLVHERRHKLAKRWSRDRSNLVNFAGGGSSHRGGQLQNN